MEAESEMRLESQESYDLVEVKTTEADGKRGSGSGRKRKPSDPSDVDSVELLIPIATRIFVYTGM